MAFACTSVFAWYIAYGFSNLFDKIAKICKDKSIEEYHPGIFQQQAKQKHFAQDLKMSSILSQ